MHTTLQGCGILASAACQSAVAAPLPQVAADTPAPPVFQTVGYWKRYCRYNDCTETPMSWWFPRRLPPRFPPSPLQLWFGKARR
jgi:hypothetical protein